jgi:hypothetical protein
LAYFNFPNQKPSQRTTSSAKNKRRQKTSPSENYCFLTGTGESPAARNPEGKIKLIDKSGI